MPEIDPIILELRADLTAYQSELRRVTRVVDTQFGRQERSAIQLERQMQRSSAGIGRSVRNLAATFGLAFTGRELIGLIDNFTQLQNSLRVTGLEGAELLSIQQRLLDISAQYGSDVNALAGVFSKAQLAQDSLGASTEDIIRLNETVAASLRITGTSTEQARGALLQLGQALGQPIIRGEEFNSLIEGARPLLQAAARGIERFDGNVNALTLAVKDGTVSNREFFNGILAGSEATIKLANDTELTLGGALTNLRNQLIVLVGTQSQAAGTTAALSNSIEFLADNLDAIIPAIATIISIVGVRYVAAAAIATAGNVKLSASNVLLAGTATGAATSMGFLGSSVFAYQARAAGAATTSEALRFVLGGTATRAGLLTAAIGLAVIGAVQLVNAYSDYTGQMELANKETLDGEAAVLALADATELAKQASDRLTGAKGAERQAILDALNAKRAEIKVSLENAKALQIEARAALESARAREENLRAQERQDLDRVNRFAGVDGAPAASITLQTLTIDRISRQNNLAENRINSTDRSIANTEARLDKLSAVIDGASSSIPARVSEAIGNTGRGRTSRNTGLTAEELEQEQLQRDLRVQQEFRQIDQEILGAKIALSTNAEERADFEIESLNLERQQRISEINNDRDLTEKERNARLALIDELFGSDSTVNEQGIVTEGNRGLLAIEVAREREAQIAQESAQLAQAQLDIDRDNLQSELDRAVTRGERERIMLEIVDLEFRNRNALLDAVIYSEDTSDAQKQIAQLTKDSLKAAQERANEDIKQDNESPLEVFRRSLLKDAQNFDDRIEDIEVRGLMSLNDQLTDAITGAQSLGDAFRNVANQIINDLIRIAIQQAIIRPLSDLLGGGSSGGGGGLGSLLGSIPGFANGTNSAPGGLAIVGERGPELVNLPRGSQVIPNMETNNILSSAGGQGFSGTLRVVLSEDLNGRMTATAGAVAVEVVREAAGPISDMGADKAIARSQRPRL